MMAYMEINLLKMEPPSDVQFVLAQSHFVKTCEDVSECLVNCVPGIKFGCGFCEANGPSLVTHGGNGEILEKLATEYAYGISAGHSFSNFVKECIPN